MKKLLGSIILLFFVHFFVSADAKTLQNVHEYFKQKNYLQALIFCKRSYQHASFADLGKIFDTEQQCLQNLDQTVPSGWYYAGVRILLLIPRLLLMLALLIVLLQILFLLYHSWQKEFQFSKFLILIGIAIFCGLIWYGQELILKKDRAFVVKDNVIVYAGPEQSFHKISQLKLATQVQIVQQQKNMSQIVIQGQHGWIMTDQIEVV